MTMFKISYFALIICAAVLFTGCEQGSNSSSGGDEAVSQQGSTDTNIACASCGVVTAIRPVAVKGEGSGSGAVIGAVVGGLLGHQVGGGSGKDVATVVGAVGGAVAGNEIEKRARGQKYFAVDVSLDVGGTQTVNVANADTIAVGTPVKIVGNNLELL